MSVAVALKIPDSHYNPSTGRFLSEDPIGFISGDTNLYRYIQNDPINFLDPFGLCPDYDTEINFYDPSNQNDGIDGVYPVLSVLGGVKAFQISKAAAPAIAYTTLETSGGQLLFQFGRRGVSRPGLLNPKGSSTAVGESFRNINGQGVERVFRVKILGRKVSDIVIPFRSTR
ncbi:MAG: hypothetical protein CME65_08340 [Halobacteriovoraceae bacterium]|nr:hypothetical protein [Halobacteriovoraceae bacterium]|tara:strand:+ start:199 stop:714 length:516 start_codon:yes stop_codon:yes gene_type:complete